MAKAGILQDIVTLVDLIVPDVVEQELRAFEQGGYVGSDGYASAKPGISSREILDGGERERLYRARTATRWCSVAAP